ncbi:hypothetical protein AAVH_17758 [Aphelenchoides avenae]|nr:hypothetical protein AAVH_17758 [Aphelenchus avenae]
MTTRLLPPTVGGNSNVLVDANRRSRTVDDANVTVARTKRALKPPTVYSPQVTASARGSSEGSKGVSPDSHRGAGRDGEKKKTGGPVTSRLLPPTVLQAQVVVTNVLEGVERDVLADANHRGGVSGKEKKKAGPVTSRLLPPSVLQAQQVPVTKGEPTEAAVRSLVEDLAAMGANGARGVGVKDEPTEGAPFIGPPVAPMGLSADPVVAPLHGEALLEVTDATHYYRLFLKQKERKRSREITVGGFQWQLETFSYWDGRDPDLAFYVYCRSARPKPWSVKAHCVVRIQRTGMEDRVERFTNIWESKKKDEDPSSGWADYMSIRELLRVPNGYLTDNTIRFRFSIVALSTDDDDAVTARYAKHLDGDLTTAIEVFDRADLDHFKKQVLVAASNEELRCWGKPQVRSTFRDSTKNLLWDEFASRLKP